MSQEKMRMKKLRELIRLSNESKIKNKNQQNNNNQTANPIRVKKNLFFIILIKNILLSCQIYFGNAH